MIMSLHYFFVFLEGVLLGAMERCLHHWNLMDVGRLVASGLSVADVCEAVGLPFHVNATEVT